MGQDHQGCGHQGRLIAWFGLVAPAGTPRDIVKKLHDTTVQALAKPDAKARFDAVGTDIAPLNPEQFAGFIKSEIAKWAKLAKVAKLEAQ